MGTKQLIVYATGSGAVRRIIVDENDNLDSQAHVGPGESAIIVDKPANKGERADVHFARRMVEAAIGKPSPDLKAAVVDRDGIVRAVIPADPDLDAIPEHDLIEAYHAEIVPGDTYDKASKLFTARERVIKAGEFIDERTGVANDRDIVVPAKVLPKPVKTEAEAGK